MIVRSATLAVGLWSVLTEAVFYKIDTPDAIRQSARTLAYDAMTFYHGNETGQIIGILPGPPASGTGDYYWYQGGAMMGAYIDYWHFTGDTSYNNVVMQAMQFQVGEYDNYEPSNWTASLGNDDQAFWGMSAMLAAETKFPNPPADKPQWLALAQAVWNRQAMPLRHDKECGGGMRWQIPSVNVGYDYKNTIANACFMNIGARLARYTGNDSYAASASDTWDWMWRKNYIDHDTYSVYDGGHVEHDCNDVGKATFGANGAVLIQAVAFLYNHTKEAKWEDRLDKLLNRFLINNFKNGVAFEPNCEPNKGCNSDMLWFKGYMHRWLSVVAQIAPKTAEKILPILKTSTQAAVNQCTGGDSGRKCGFFWSSGQYVDPAVTKTSGAGEQINVLSAVSSLLVDSAMPPVTAKTGGISQGKTDAGIGGGYSPKEFRPLKTADKAGAGILTALLLGGVSCMFVWMSL